MKTILIYDFNRKKVAIYLSIIVKHPIMPAIFTQKYAWHNACQRDNKHKHITLWERLLGSI